MKCNLKTMKSERARKKFAYMEMEEVRNINRFFALCKLRNIQRITDKKQINLLCRILGVISFIIAFMPNGLFIPFSMLGCWFFGVSMSDVLFYLAKKRKGIVHKVKFSLWRLRQ